jgi:hypothetical protein
MEVFRIAGVGKAGGCGGYGFDEGSFGVRSRFVDGSFGVRFWWVVVCFVGVGGFVSDLPFFWTREVR